MTKSSPFLIPFTIALLGIPVSAQGGYLAAPTSVDASDTAYQRKTQITWDAVPHATAYRIFRNSSNDPGAATDLGTTVSWTFYDTSGADNTVYYYWVRAENSSAVSALSAPDQGSREVTEAFGPVAPLEPPPEPPGNPVTYPKVNLGKSLFWDEQLSSTRTTACGTCHRPGTGGTDPRAVFGITMHPGPDGMFGTSDDVNGSSGVPLSFSDGTYSLSGFFGIEPQITTRYPRATTDAAYSAELFLEGRATDEFRDPITNAVVLASGAALETQVGSPPVSSSEMAHIGRDWVQVAARVTTSKPLALATSIPAGLENWIAARNYPQLFDEAFGDPDVTPSRIAMAIASYERTLYSDRTKFDAILGKIDGVIETAQEQNGRMLFSQVACSQCHAGSHLSDNLYHNTGLRPVDVAGGTAEEPGRFLVTGVPNDLGTVRTPSLRNVALRGAFMSNGGMASLSEVVEFYNRGGDHDASNIDFLLIPPFGLGLAPFQIDELVAFMTGEFTDARVQNETFPFDRPTLFSETARVPAISGTGVAGSGGAVPVPVALEPPISGNPNFTVAVHSALGGAQATLAIDAVDPGTAGVPASASFALLSTTLSGAGAGAGFGSIVLSIPDDATLDGTALRGRWYIDDPGAAGGVAVSPLIEIAVFRPDHSTYYTWRGATFGPGAPPGSNMEDDPDGDRLSNLFEYLAGSNARIADARFAPLLGTVIQESEEFQTITYTRRLGVVDVTDRVEASEDLTTWSSGPPLLENPGAPTSNGDGTETLTVRLKDTPQSRSRVFMRLRTESVGP